MKALRQSGGATDAQIADAEAQVASARSGLEQAQASVTSANAQVAQAQASVSSANAQVVQSRDAVNDTVLRAPIAGTVVQVNGTVGQDSSTTSASDTTSSTTSGFVVISDMDHLQVAANFSETDTASLRVGQRATVTLNAQPDVEISGEVIAIDETSTTVNQVVNYGVTIRLQRPPQTCGWDRRWWPRSSPVEHETSCWSRPPRSQPRAGRAPSPSCRTASRSRPPSRSVSRETSPPRSLPACPRATRS